MPKIYRILTVPRCISGPNLEILQCNLNRWWVMTWTNPKWGKLCRLNQIWPSTPRPTRPPNNCDLNQDVLHFWSKWWPQLWEWFSTAAHNPCHFCRYIVHAHFHCSFPPFIPYRVCWELPVMLHSFLSAWLHQHHTFCNRQQLAIFVKYIIK